MKKTIWFKAKEYGWGWYPSTFQGFLIIILYIVLVVETFMLVERYAVSEKDAVMTFVPLMVLYTAALIIICYLTGEKPEWRWGKKK